MELDDKVKVILTEAGADYLIEKNKFFRRIATKYATLSIDEIDKYYPINYHDQQVIRGTLKEIILTFDVALMMTKKDTPFTNLQLDDERCSCRASVRVSQVT